MDYFEICEEEDNALFAKWAEDTGWFKETRRNGRYDLVDWHCTDLKGRKVAVEVKKRENAQGKYETVFFEPLKYEALEESFNKGFIPLYLVFFEGGEAALWDWRKMDKASLEAGKTQHDIIDKGKGKAVPVTRYHLRIEDAITFTILGGTWTQRIKKVEGLKGNGGGGSLPRN